MTKRHCTPSDIIKLSPAISLHLECGSHCSTPDRERLSIEYFSWKKYLDISRSGSVIQLPDTPHPLLSVDSVTHEDGGHYVCKCQPSGPECMYNVSVIPEMTFEASQLAIHHGDNFDLTCTVRGFPANITTIKTRAEVELKNQIHGRLDSFTTRAFVPIMGSEHTEFFCVSESYLLGSLVARLEKHISVHFYSDFVCRTFYPSSTPPPVIIFTTEFVIRGQDEFGKPGHLTCTVQASPDTGSTVAWWVNGSRIEAKNGGKYNIEVIPMGPEDVLQYRLTIDDLCHSDIGSYLCQLSTQYRVEDSQEAWLQVDFRKGSDEWGKTHERGEYQPNNWRGNSPDGRSDMVFFGVCSMTMICCVLILWKLATSRKGRRKSKATPITGYCSPTGPSIETGDHTHPTRPQVVGLRRKYS